MSTQLRVNATVTSNSFPSGIAPFSSASTVFGMAVAQNPKRAQVFIQNIHTGIPLYVLFGTGAAGTGNFSLVLNPGGNLGLGGEKYLCDCYKGQVNASGGAWQAWEM